MCLRTSNASNKDSCHKIKKWKTKCLDPFVDLMLLIEYAEHGLVHVLKILFSY